MLNLVFQLHTCLFRKCLLYILLQVDLSVRHVRWHVDTSSLRRTGSICLRDIEARMVFIETVGALRYGRLNYVNCRIKRVA